ncbi:SDR family NAD(P)-dependent oxidoreductase [Phreatobacter sp.]|uniref:SDR family NAD(P)-dependent oxidoreductase n=1 Tax=Phreatobacter sp. TaxID=1966341 RepID=UPI003F71C645
MQPNGQKRAWITGAGKGIGRDLALELVRRGWWVAVSARTADDLKQLEQMAPGRISGIALDVTDTAAVGRVVETIEQDSGPLDLVVLNAGTHIPMTAAGFDIGALRKLVETNLMGVGNGVAAVLPRFMARRAGHLAVVSSVAGFRGLPTSAGYGATKAALINMCEALKPECDAAGVKLQLICPGFVDTPLTKRNDFPMPFLISSERAATIMADGLESSRFSIVFPFRMRLAMAVLRRLPDRLLFAVTRRMLGPADGGSPPAAGR